MRKNRTSNVSPMSRDGDKTEPNSSEFKHDKSDRIARKSTASFMNKSLSSANRRTKEMRKKRTAMMSPMSGEGDFLSQEMEEVAERTENEF